jgi:hypothetical protein
VIFEGGLRAALPPINSLTVIDALSGRCTVSDALKRAEHYRDLAKRYLRLAAISSTKNRNHYRRIAEQCTTLAEAEELSTPARVNGE